VCVCVRKNIVKYGGATRGRNAGARFLRIMRFTAECEYTPGLMAKTATLKNRAEQSHWGNPNRLLVRILCWQHCTLRFQIINRDTKVETNPNLNVFLKHNKNDDIYVKNSI
jgi:hypothetical protein